MKTHRIAQGILLVGLIALAAAQPAFAELKIKLVALQNNQPPPAFPLIAGGGKLKDIMEVAAENWERVYKHRGSKWNVTIEYGWAAGGR